MAKNPTQSNGSTADAGTTKTATVNIPTRVGNPGLVQASKVGLGRLQSNAKKIVLVLLALALIYSLREYIWAPYTIIDGGVAVPTIAPPDTQGQQPVYGCGGPVKSYTLEPNVWSTVNPGGGCDSDLYYNKDAGVRFVARRAPWTGDTTEYHASWGSPLPHNIESIRGDGGTYTIGVGLSPPGHVRP